MQRSKSKILIIVFLTCLLVFLGAWVGLYYPRQIMPLGQNVEVLTPDFCKYHNDCLHPCIRFEASSSCYYMVQSPWYQSRDSIENPIFYQSRDLLSWTEGYVLAETPRYGYNSDPNLYLTSDNQIFCIWREVATPYCDSLGVATALRGGLVTDNVVDSLVDYAFSYDATISTEISPIILQRPGDDSYFMYASWYQRSQPRKNKGLAIWKGTSLSSPDFTLIDTLPIQSTLTVDKWKQLQIGKKLLFVPQPKWHDIWHFDLFEYDGDLYMISCAEMDDNIMLSKSEDWVNFTTYKTPLVNAHYTESQIGKRLYLYKPTAFIKNDSLHLFYTGNEQNSTENWRNRLYHTVKPMREILSELE